MAILKLNRNAPYPFAGLVLIPGRNRVTDEYVENMMSNKIVAREFEAGVFTLLDDDGEALEPVTVRDDPAPVLPEKPFDEMTVPELDAACRKRGIELTGLKNKTDKLAALVAHTEADK